MATTPTQNAVPSESPRDLKFNIGKFDEVITSMTNQYIDRFGRAHYTVEGLKKLILDAIYNLGLNPVGNFQGGATLDSANDIIQDTSTGIWYRWDNTATLPKVVPAGSNPASTGGTGEGAWLAVDVSDVLRRDLNDNGGASLVRASDGRTVQQWIIANDSAEYRARNISKLAWVDYQVHNRGSFKALFQGDSMTAGYDIVTTDSVPPENGDAARHASMTYPKRFMEFLPEQSGCSVIGVYRAISGHTAIQSYNQPEWQSNPGCDVVILMLGLNDAAGAAGTTEDTYMEYMEKLIRRFIDWGMGVVLQTCSWSGQINGSLLANKWAKRLRTVANIYGCAHFNADEVQYYRHNAAITSDGGHFNSMGYAIHGQMLASMFMAGGLLPEYRPLSNEMTTWPGRMDDSVGYCDASNLIGLTRADGAVTRPKVTGELPGNKSAIVSFSFYLDADAAHIFGHVTGRGPLAIITDAPGWWNNNANDYYAYASNQAINFQNSPQADSVNNFDLSLQYGPTRKFAGRVLGRGWKTISLFTPLDNSGLEAYVNSLTIQPVPVGFSVQARNWERWDKGVRSVVHRKFPSAYNRGTVPDPVALTEFKVPFPQSMLPVTPSVSGDLNDAFYNSGHAIMKISNSNGDYLEVLFNKTSGGYTFTGTILKTTYSDSGRPTAISGRMVHMGRDLLKAAGANGDNMPRENIYNVSSSNYVEMPNVDIGGIVLITTITWPGASPNSYWNVEVEFTDMFGSSETSL